ncbi:phosphate acetyltransferase [Nakamurella flavida]|uniref:Phosphate acetyltransferase n=1 Tax=Nakamurella flavida TaxID=363630 RepID=A0A938YEU8_9ACTN|nr:phosphate acetyltransferase [Nakamurella flavida]MBM9476375.1 phosphate acetyltransferase [Nakamurella flavida]MDP9779525.1 phosphate acetyltransferase [Nakamurella flavida]
MSRSVYIASPEGASGKSTVSWGLLNLLTQRIGRVAVFRPVFDSPDEIDPVVELLLSHPAVQQEYADAVGVSYAQWHADPEGSLSDIVNAFRALSARYDLVLVQGSDYTDVTTGGEMAVNSVVAANLGAPVVLVVHGRDRTPAQIRAAAAVARTELTSAYAHPVAVIANRVDPAQLDEVKALLALDGGLAVGAIPEIPVLVAPTVRALVQACGGRVVRGNPAWLERESLGFVVAAMSLPNVLTRLTEDCTVIAPGDRSDLLPGLILAHQSGTFPHLSCIVLTGGYAPPEPIAQLIDGIQQDLPIVVSDHGTFETASLLSGVRGRLEAGSPVKMETALRAFADGVDSEALLAAMDVGDSAVTTPLMFQFQLTERARADRKHVVLPEADDDRVLRAAASLLRLGVADLTLLGEERAVRARASTIGVDLSGAQVVSPHDPELVERFAAEYARIRAHKGMTLERARDVVTDVSYFGTMMVHLGMADGMVSGAAHTTAHTIRPSFEIIRTAPGTAIVSSVFLMCLADRVLVYGDCAVNPDPTAQELADIAISSAATAAQFGVQPRVAMLSYSTGSSGSGADVDKVRQATEIVRAQRPDLSVDGPIQYDAAVDPTVAAAKLPDSPVAGRATVLIFPDLNTGNNTYKAVQRSANAVAIGPVLQGLNRPVNDLSRGALVADIVNTVVITAVQAQGHTPATDQEATS